MAHLSPEEVTKNHIEKMGEDLGAQFDALWHDVVWLHRKWSEYVELFGLKESRVRLLNRAAPKFFHMIQSVLWEETLLHIARVTDNPTSSAQKQNLTIRNLADLIGDPDARMAVSALVDKAIDETRFCRDWRNRHIAHRDLDLAMKKSAVPLEGASRKQVKAAIEAIEAALQAVEDYYTKSRTYFDGVFGSGGAESLLYVIDDGLRAQDAGRERRRRGDTSDSDYSPDI